jgi:RNA polymerase primary sigma factor
MRQLTITNKITNRETESFAQYLKDISKIEIFTPEEELICAKKASMGERLAMEELIEKNLRFVVSVAKQYANPLNPLEDLVNEGNIGLIIAVEKFKPDMGFKFISYAVWWIRKIIMEYMCKHSKMVRLPANKINVLSKLDKKISETEQILGRSVDAQEIIEELGDSFNTSDLNFLNLLNTYRMDSLDREIGGDDGTHTVLSEAICDDSFYEKTDHLLITNDTKSEITRLLNTLKPRDKRVMTAIYGLDGQLPMTLKEIGEEIGVTREMIRQIKEKSLSNFRVLLENSILRTCQ